MLVAFNQSINQSIIYFPYYLVQAKPKIWKWS